MQNVAEAYLETQVLTASPERLHLMVVDAAVRFARQSLGALEEKNIEAAYLALTRSRSCISEILTGIDAKPNPELAERLRALFVFVHQNLTRADLMRDPQLVREALEILQIHRKTWLDLMARLQPEQADCAEPHAIEAGEISWTT
jgi:flagellar protein FliS